MKNKYGINLPFKSMELYLEFENTLKQNEFLRADVVSYIDININIMVVLTYF